MCTECVKYHTQYFLNELHKNSEIAERKSVSAFTKFKLADALGKKRKILTYSYMDDETMQNKKNPGK